MSKTYTGGYRLVSLAFIDLALASTAIAVAGLGDALGVKSRKRVVLTDIVVSGEKKNDLSVQVKKDGDNFVIEDVYGYDLEIVTSGSTLKATPHADSITASDIDSGSATSGQVLTADGSGGASFANPAGGGTKLYRHTIRTSGGAFGYTFVNASLEQATTVTALLASSKTSANAYTDDGKILYESNKFVSFALYYSGSEASFRIDKIDLSDLSNPTVLQTINKDSDYTDTVTEL